MCLIVLSLCWCCIVCSSSSIFSFLCYVLWTMCLIVLSLCWCCIVCSSSSIFSFLCYVLWTIVLLSFVFVCWWTIVLLSCSSFLNLVVCLCFNVVDHCLIVLSLCWCCIVCSSSSIFSFLCYVLWTIVLLSFLFVDVVLSVPLPQSLVFYVMFCGPLSYCPFSLLMLYLSVPLPQSLVFYVMFCGPLSYCPFSLLMLYCLFLFLNL